MKKTIMIAVLLTIVLFSGAAFAEYVYDPDLNNRLVNQEKRMVQGLKSGELTLREAEQLAKELKGIVEKKRRFRSGGVLTRADRAILHRDFDRSSKHIYEQKHDSQRRH